MSNWREDEDDDGCSILVIIPAPAPFIHTALGFANSPIVQGGDELKSLHNFYSWIEGQMLIACPNVKRVASDHNGYQTPVVNIPAGPEGAPAIVLTHYYRKHMPFIFYNLTAAEMCQFISNISRGTWAELCIANEMSLGTITVMEKVQRRMSIEIVVAGPFLGHGGF